MRCAVDIDLLVPPGQTAPAWQVLDRLGYTALNPPVPLVGARLQLFRWAAKDSLHRHPDTGVTVELHWRMSDELPEGAASDGGARQTVTLGQAGDLVTLADGPLFVYLATHGAAHAWARLKWLSDVAVLLSRRADRGAALWQYACTQRAGLAAASAIELADELFGLAPPPGYRRPRAWRLAGLLALSRDAIGAGGGTRDLALRANRGWSEMASKLLLSPGLRGLGAVLRRLVFCGEDIARVALPLPLFWLYPLLRLPLLVLRRARRSTSKARLHAAGGRGNTAR